MHFLLKIGSTLLFTAVLITGCNSSPSSSSSESPSPSPIAASPSPSATAAPESPQPIQEEAPLISAQGMGAAQLGITLGELKQQLGQDTEFLVKAPFIVDFDAIAVRKGGETQYYILYLAGQSFADQDVIQGVFTDNPKFRTAEGVGAGTTLQDAAQAYGQATLSYNTGNESREYARFERQPATNISFATGNGSTSTAGIYGSPVSEYNETENYRAEATIQSVLVVCLTDACAPPSP
ncbi:MAG: hypothetical protein KME15_02755 [Drouetiella hepatica Uher 2000/2452]|uniref:Lipoprotein n=1 Tax=Drouetiella hepatica Uher 2000/2452 TaxID=904376 RepID=A0A951Q988_9CYAN|nr:hypothetical protein [Drouetiella hepatica Uher 2000/2452]